MEMADWPGWVGMGTGLTGTALAIVSYIRAGKLKKLDLYIEAGRVANELRQAYKQLVELHQVALKNRQTLAAAIGQSRGGAMAKWEGEWSADELVIRELASLIPDEDIDYKALKPEELSTIVVELDRTLQQVNTLVDKYNGWAEWNEKRGDQIRASMNAKL